eukprot:gene19624-biopygen6202
MRKSVIFIFERNTRDTSNQVINRVEVGGLARPPSPGVAAAAPEKFMGYYYIFRRNILVIIIFRFGSTKRRGVVTCKIYNYDKKVRAELDETNVRRNSQIQRRNVEMSNNNPRCKFTEHIDLLFPDVLVGALYDTVRVKCPKAPLFLGNPVRDSQRKRGQPQRVPFRGGGAHLITNDLAQQPLLDPIEGDSSKRHTSCAQSHVGETQRPRNLGSCASVGSWLQRLTQKSRPALRPAVGALLVTTKEKGERLAELLRQSITFAELIRVTEWARKYDRVQDRVHFELYLDFSWVFGMRMSEFAEDTTGTLSPHCFRHARAVQLICADVPRASIRSIMRMTEKTLNRYQIHNPEE